MHSRGQVNGNHPNNNNNNSNQQQNKGAYRGISRKSRLFRAAAGSRAAADRVTIARALCKVGKGHDDAKVFGSHEEASANASTIRFCLCLESLMQGFFFSRGSLRVPRVCWRTRCINGLLCHDLQKSQNQRQRFIWLNGMKKENLKMHKLAKEISVSAASSE